MYFFANDVTFFMFIFVDTNIKTKKVVSRQPNLFT